MKIEISGSQFPAPRQSKKIKLYILSFILGFWVPGFLGHNCYAKEITVLFTGQTHAMLYTCSCPVENDGGVARRGTLVKKLRAKNPNLLLLDSGNFFAGGLFDEHTQNAQLDMRRSLTNLKAMELMKYDAVAVGSDEFNFGAGFFQENAKKTDLTFLSANFSGAKALPFIIKEISGVKIGIIGLTNPVIQQKSPGINFTHPNSACLDAVSKLRENKIDIIIVLSNLSEAENLNLIGEVKDIDILIASYKTKGETYNKVGRTLMINPAWQGRKLGILTLNLKDKKTADFKVSFSRLSSEVKDDPAIKAILPNCFSYSDCKNKDGMAGACLRAGTLQASCEFQEQKKVRVLVIVPKNCLICETKAALSFLKSYMPGLVSEQIYYPGAKAAELIKKLQISSLPAYLVERGAQEEKNFTNFKDILLEKGEFYLVAPQVSGMSYFWPGS